LIGKTEYEIFAKSEITKFAVGNVEGRLRARC
jgi:hypothetical protein